MRNLLDKMSKVQQSALDKLDAAKQEQCSGVEKEGVAAAAEAAGGSGPNEETGRRGTGAFKTARLTQQSLIADIVEPLFEASQDAVIAKTISENRDTCILIANMLSASICPLLALTEFSGGEQYPILGISVSFALHRRRFIPLF